MKKNHIRVLSLCAALAISFSTLFAPLDVLADSSQSMTIVVDAKEKTPEEEYAVKFNSNGGSSVSSQVVKQGKVPKRPTDPVRVGYEFEGWYTDSTFSYSYSFTEPLEEDVLLIAKWKAVVEQTYLVVFEENGGSTTSSATVVAGDVLKKPTNPTRAGYTFDGWYSDVTLKNRYDFSRIVTSNMSLYAKWTEIKKVSGQHTVYFNSNGGSSVGQQKVDDGSKLSKPIDPQKSGYKFEGWYSDYNFSSLYNFNNAVTQDVTLYAKWSKVESTGNENKTPTTQTTQKPATASSPLVTTPVVSNTPKASQSPSATSSPNKVVSTPKPTATPTAKPKNIAKEQEKVVPTTLEEAKKLYEEELEKLEDKPKETWDSANDDQKSLVAQANPEVFDEVFNAWEIYQKFLKEAEDSKSDIEKAYEKYIEIYESLDDDSKAKWNDADISEKFYLSEDFKEKYDSLYKAWSEWQVLLGKDITPEDRVEEDALSNHVVEDLGEDENETSKAGSSWLMELAFGFILLIFILLIVFVVLGIGGRGPLGFLARSKYKG